MRLILGGTIFCHNIIFMLTHRFPEKVNIGNMKFDRVVSKVYSYCIRRWYIKIDSFDKSSYVKFDVSKHIKLFQISQILYTWSIVHWWIYGKNYQRYHILSLTSWCKLIKSLYKNLENIIWAANQSSILQEYFIINNHNKKDLAKKHVY